MRPAVKSSRGPLSFPQQSFPLDCSFSHIAQLLRDLLLICEDSKSSPLADTMDRDEMNKYFNVFELTGDMTKDME